MSTLFTNVRINGEEILILNRNYSKEQLREKLSVPEGGYSSEDIEHIFARGIFLEEPLTIVCRCEEGVITTQQPCCWWYVHEKDTLTVNPDGGFVREEYQSFWDRIGLTDFIRNLYSANCELRERIIKKSVRQN